LRTTGLDPEEPSEVFENRQVFETFHGSYFAILMKRNAGMKTTENWIRTSSATVNDSNGIMLSVLKKQNFVVSI